MRIECLLNHFRLYSQKLAAENMKVSEYVNKSHNVTALIYRLVFPAKYRRAVFDEHADEVMKDVCMEIEKRYQMKFLEICTDKDHVHFLEQSIPTYIVTRVYLMVLRSVTERRSTKFAAKYPFGDCPLEEGAQACKAVAMTS